MLAPGTAVDLLPACSSHAGARDVRLHCVLSSACQVAEQACGHAEVKAVPCMQAATSAPLIERSIERATGIVYNITGGSDLTLQEVGWLLRQQRLPCC